MPYDDPDPTDPMTLHGMSCETEDDGAVREMAHCFIEEYFRLGFDPDRIFRMFSTQGYLGPNMALETLGEETIRDLINELATVWAGRWNRDSLVRDEQGDIGLKVLDHDGSSETGHHDSE